MMMNRKSTFYLSFLIAILFFVSACKNNIETKLNPTEFQNPPKSVKIHTWWHWLDGNVTKEGITKDLEAMKEQGIVQATILNVGLFGDKDFGVKKVDFNSEVWFELFKWALKEANRLGISIGAHNCDGWSTSGGPWITQEMSMKQYTWTKTLINVSQSAGLKLKQPMAKDNFYRDVAVIAFKNSDSLSSISKAKPVITLNDSVNAGHLNDGCPVSAYNLSKSNFITFTYSEIYTAEKLTILPRRSFMWGNPDDYISNYTLSSSVDGKNFKKIINFKIQGLNRSQTIQFPKTSAKVYRLVLTETNNIDSWLPFTIGEFELLPLNEKPAYSPDVEYLSEKTGDIKASKEDYFYQISNTEPGHKKEVIDITSKMAADGTLNWKPSEGSWTIIRFGYTTTGALNGPATKAGTGLECDKMDSAALDLHFKNFPSKLIEKAGSYAGNTFKFMLIDSWECGYQNWTAKLPQEFEKLRGYSLINFIPVLCGESLGDPQIDNAVLYDFRKTIADLIETNYYRHFSYLLHQKKMEFHAEIIYGNANYPPLDILKTTSYVDLPMYEFWSATDKDLNVIYTPMSGIELNMPSCAAIGYEKPVMASEAYTGMAHYSETPATLKSFGDRAYCAGINQMILHSYVHQPTDNKPGMTLGQFGSHFNRNNNYWKYISEWFNFQSRIQYVLQKGVAFHDVLYFLGDQLPQYLVYNKSNTLPFGYMMNACNFDILKNRIEVSGGKLVLNNQTSYSLLSLPPYENINLETLQRLEELVKKGAVIYAPKPLNLLSYKDLTTNGKQFEELTNKIWGKIDGKSITENTYGQGKVYWGIPISEVLKKQQMLPDISTNQNDSANLMFIHKKLGDTDVYFVFNQQNIKLDREISFRVIGKTPAIWNPEYGTVTKPTIFSIDKNYTTLPVTFLPHESKIFVFENGKPESFISTVKQNGINIFPSANRDLTTVPEIISEGNKFIAISGLEGSYELITNENKHISLKSSRTEEIQITDITGKLSFDAPYQAKISPLSFTALSSYTETENPDIKYFSGTGNYSISFKIPEEKISKADSILLDLGEFESVAEVKLNGSNLGRLWKQGKYLNVKRILKTENILEVSIANTFRNRFIGDYIQYGKVQNLWTSSPIGDFLNKDRPLQRSGLIGPLRIIIISKQLLN